MEIEVTVKIRYFYDNLSPGEIFLFVGGSASYYLKTDQGHVNVVTGIVCTPVCSSTLVEPYNAILRITGRK